MKPPGTQPPPPLPSLPKPASAQTPEQALHRLFLTLFLRGRGARGLNRKAAPTSIGNKLAMTLFLYALIGCVALSFRHQPVFALSAYLHGMTFMLVGMFVASSAGEILFNRDEGEILLHRPIQPRTLLWAKIRVLVEVSLYLAGALNLAGLYTGLGASDGGWRFPVVHAVSTVLAALFCTGSIVLMYQLCLRWFGRERLDGVMTAAQIFVSIAVVLSGQILPRILFKLGHVLALNESSWWIFLLPPAWFAGFDDAFSGSASPVSWAFAAMALAVTGFVLWMAFGRLAHSYDSGLQLLNETVSPEKSKPSRRRVLDRLVRIPPLSWWLREPVSRASFLLIAAYLLRDRDTKLRVYPGIAPMLVLPFIFLFQGGKANGMGIAFAGAYLGMIPFLAMGLLQFSQQWQASDVFRYAPMPGPGPICHGARRAVLLFLTLPVVAGLAIVSVLAMRGLSPQLYLLLPGIVLLPINALWPSAIGHSIPFSKPTEEAKSAGRGLWMMVTMFGSMALSGLAFWTWSVGWFWTYLAIETALAAGAYLGLRRVVGNLKWEPAE